MKPTYLLGLSVAAAAIIFSGCGSSDDAANPAAITAPDAVKQAIDLNQSTIQNVMAFMRYRTGGVPAPQRAASNTSSSETYTEDCDLGGTHTFTSQNTYVNEDDGSYTSNYVWSDDYNNCIYSSSNSYPSFTANRHTQNGTVSSYYNDHYDATTNGYKYSYGGEDNYTNIYDNNETDYGASSYTESNTRIFDNTYDSIPGTWTWNEYSNGERSYLETNATGDIVGGNKTTYDRFSLENTNQPELESHKANGSYTYITYNSDGTTNLNAADYFVNFAFSSNGSDDHNISVSGKVGTLCLGGSVSFTTSPVVREDQMSYLDDTNNTGSNVLPYTGVVTMTGTSTATVTFDNNTTHSHAVVHTGSTDMTYGSWSELAVGPCD